MRVGGASEDPAWVQKARPRLSQGRGPGSRDSLGWGHGGGTVHGTWYPSKVVCLQGLQAGKPTAVARQAPSGQPQASALPLGLSLGVTVSHLVTQASPWEYSCGCACWRPACPWPCAVTPTCSQSHTAFLWWTRASLPGPSPYRAARRPPQVGRPELQTGHRLKSGLVQVLSATYSLGDVG